MGWIKKDAEIYCLIAMEKKYYPMEAKEIRSCTAPIAKLEQNQVQS